MGRKVTVNNMNVGIVGLGLIGGSIAKSLKTSAGHHVFGFDINDSTLYKAKLTDAIDDVLTNEVISICDIIIVALYPKDTVNYVIKNARLFKSGAIILDTCGVKSVICEPIWKGIAGFDITFVGAHPMAGRELSGFDASKNTLFNNASMIMTPPKNIDIAALDLLKKLWLSIGFTQMQITTPAEHDKLIAFTSQLAHVASSAYIKSPTATRHRGFSAGSYKDMTRVAKLNETMWTELFLSNKDALCDEIESFAARLLEYSNAIKNNDEKTLYTLLSEGCKAKALAEKRGNAQ